MGRTRSTTQESAQAEVPAIHADALSKVYRGRLAVDKLNLQVPVGSIFGFLGPNGAGKTTTIRMLIGLVRPSSGQATVLGVPTPSGLGAVRGQIGCLQEAPAFYPNMSARDNLELLSSVGSFAVPPSRLSELLHDAGLEERADDRVGSFSHGMRQRLGIAAALLNDPALVIMDEPATALDPQGMRDVRDLLVRLRDAGKTIFLSSHLLSEVEQICDHVCIISNGTTKFNGALPQLRADFAESIKSESSALEEIFLQLTRPTPAAASDSSHPPK